MHHKWQLYEVWFLRYGAQQTEFLLIWIIFLPFYPPNNLENQKIPRDIIILHNFTENDIHMMYSSWDMERGRQNFLPFWTIFCPFTSLTIQKIKNSKKWKKCLEISSFYTSASKTMIICHTVPEIWHVMDEIYFSFWAIITLTFQKIKIF